MSDAERLTLTFDDGPSEWTEPILDILAARGERAMFFLVGKAIDGRDATVKRMFEDGHAVGVHSWSHGRLTSMDDDMVRLELGATVNRIYTITDELPTLYRAPYFDHDDRVDRHAGELGLRHVDASIVPDDWSLADPAEIVARVLAAAQPGGVVCLHDGIPPDGGNGTASRQATVDAVRILLEQT